MTTPASFDRERYRRIDEVAHYLWNPIGVSRHPHARDEYASYLPTLDRGVRANDRDALVEYMEQVVAERMGLSPFDRDRAEAAAASSHTLSIVLSVT